MTAFTNYTENQIAGHIFGSATFAKPTALYIALFSAVTDGEAGSVTEISGNGYARAACAPGDSDWTQPTTDGTVSNAVTISFPAATGDWGVITAWGIFDAATAGHLLVYANLTNSRNITAGSTPSFAALGRAFRQYPPPGQTVLCRLLGRLCVWGVGKGGRLSVICLN